MNTQPWLRSPTFDLLWILAPSYLSAFLVISLSLLWDFQTIQLPLWIWVICILGVDVSHVYSTLYRTYFDKEERARYSLLLISVPIAAWTGGVLLHVVSKNLFWSCLAYLAVFHFIRQQYGFTALYARKEERSKLSRLIDILTVYSATIYPLIFWHTHLPRSFYWFVPGDFVITLPKIYADVAYWIWISLLSTFSIKELILRPNLPKYIFVMGTALSWYTGIVLFNADIPFTITNVLSHGIPYMALIWLFERRKAESLINKSKRIPLYLQLFTPAAIPLFLLILFFLAYLEEALWDGLIWRDHKAIFPWSWNLPYLSHPLVLALIVPLLSLPQTTHYILDAFIWRIRKKTHSEVYTLLND